jgi:hypothetical protein
MLIGLLPLSAQNEAIADSLPSFPANNIKMSGGFMLDMNLLMPPRLPSLKMNTDLLGPDATKDYSRLFQLPSQLMLSKSFISPPSYVYGYGMGGFFYSPAFVQTATFKLNDTMWLSTYGQYTLDGKRISNPSALPWEKNNFMGGMELKLNKHFGVRVEVQQGRDPTFPH